MKVTVRQDHIDEGERLSTSYCPVALALKDRLDDAGQPYFEIVVNADRAFLFGQTKILRRGKRLDRPVSIYHLSRRARNFIMAFDNEKEVSPSTFLLWKETS